MATDEKKKKPSKEKAAKKSASEGGGGKKASAKKGGDGGGGKRPDDYKADNVRWEDLASKVMKPAAAIGVLGLGAAAFLGNNAGDNWRQFFYSYLVAYFFVLTVGMGALFFVTLQHLVNANWSVVVRRVAEIFAANVPLLIVLALPIVVPVMMGDHTLYIWNDHQAVEADHLLHHKAPYLNAKFFGIRCLIYFGFWFWLSNTFLKRSVEQDANGKKEISGLLQKISAPSMVLFALTLTFCAFDFLMSLEPVFFSTIFGVYIFAGCVSSFHAVLALSLMWLQKNGRLTKSVTTEHFHDIGKMMFAFVVFWSYIAFSQFMLIWYADIPEETFWFKERFAGDWGMLSWALLFGHFVIPFFGLMSRWVKRSRQGLAFWSVWMLVVQYLDLYWLIMPAMQTTKAPFGAIDVLALVGVLGLFIASAAYTGAKLNLLPTKDPRLEKSLAFENI